MNKLGCIDDFEWRALGPANQRPAVCDGLASIFWSCDHLRIFFFLLFTRAHHLGLELCYRGQRQRALAAHKRDMCCAPGSLALLDVTSPAEQRV